MSRRACEIIECGRPKNCHSITVHCVFRHRPSSSGQNPMWNQLPFDLLAHIFSFLPPDSLARAASVCKHWSTCAEAPPPAIFRRHPPWFMAMQTRHRSATCYAHNLILRRWYTLPLYFLPYPIRPVSPIGSLMLCRPALACSSLQQQQQLIICNPFSRWHRVLPPPNTPRANPAVGVINASGGKEGSFRVFVAGGTSSSSASYEATLEVYESERDGWRELGEMPPEFAIRLTVWTPSGSVHAGGSLYWMTAARAYTVVGLEVGSGRWREVKVPVAERLECAALVPRRGRLAMFGGTCGGGGCVWELGEGDEWEVVEVVPGEMARRLLKGKETWEGTRCVGCDGAMCLYKDFGWGMVVWREVREKGRRWEWFWVDGCGIGELPIAQVKGVLLHPSLGAAV